MDRVVVDAHLQVGADGLDRRRVKGPLDEGCARGLHGAMGRHEDRPAVLVARRLGLRGRTRGHAPHHAGDHVPQGDAECVMSLRPPVRADPFHRRAQLCDRRGHLRLARPCANRLAIARSICYAHSRLSPTWRCVACQALAKSGEVFVFAPGYSWFSILTCLFACPPHSWGAPPIFRDLTRGQAVKTHPAAALNLTANGARLRVTAWPTGA